MPAYILQKHAENIFRKITPSKGSWFEQIKNLCLQYSLPHPATFLSSPPTKSVFKTTVKKRVIDYWEQKLRHEASLLPSLEFFHSHYMSLTRTHPLWTTAGASPSKVVMATTQAHFLSGRYRTQALCSHWSGSSSDCQLSPSCKTREDISHILKDCSALIHTREKLNNFTRSYCASNPVIAGLVEQFCTVKCRLFVQFLLDCSVIPEIIAAVQVQGQDILTHLFDITRVWVYSLHRDRLKILGRWRNFAT